jgi:S-DNA-T family DNA segregation ATPase FtsK/SpoIIIE
MAAETLPARERPGRREPGGLHLVVMGPRMTVSHRLGERPTLLVGRAEDAEVRLVDPEASRQHARLHLLPGEHVEIEDLGSANGTRVRERTLLPGARVPFAPGAPPIEAAAPPAAPAPGPRGTFIKAL